MEVRSALSALPYFIYKDVNYCYTSDLTSLLRSMNPSYRRRALICCYKIFLSASSYEEIADFENITNSIVERLQDTDQGVQISSIACIQQNAKKRPEYWVRIIPSLFKLLGSVQQNWKLIKIILTLNFFTEHEPRLKSKLKTRVEELISIVTAKSVEFQLLKLYVVKLANKADISKNIIERVLSFVDPTDANIQYLGLQLVLELRKKDIKLDKLETSLQKWLEINDLTLLRLVRHIILLSVNLQNMEFYIDAMAANMPQGSFLSAQQKQKRDFLCSLITSLFEQLIDSDHFNYWNKVFTLLLKNHLALRSALGVHFLKVNERMTSAQNQKVTQWIFSLFEAQEEEKNKVKENSTLAKYLLMSQAKENATQILSKIEELEYFQDYPDYCEGLFTLFLQVRRIEPEALKFEQVEQRVMDIVNKFPLNRALKLQAGLMQLSQGNHQGWLEQQSEEEVDLALNAKLQVPIQELNLLKKAEKV